MLIDENEIFREATLRICGILNLTSAMQQCLIYLKDFMPADMFHLSVYDRGLDALKIIAIATPEEATRENIIIHLDEKTRKGMHRRQDLISRGETIQPFILDPERTKSLWKTMTQVKGMWKDHSAMVMHLTAQETRPGNLILYAKGKNRFSKTHLRLFSILNTPFTIALANALRYDELNQIAEVMRDNIPLLHQKNRQWPEGMIIGEDFGLKKVMNMVRGVASLDTPILLQGETGVGKEIIAKAIHTLSMRKDGPFVQINCGAISDTLIDSELFGHEKGAFTGAIAQKQGCFERADGGTIFLDEVAELPLHAQVRMLRVLQEKKIFRVGGNQEIPVDIRVIAATHQNLQSMVNKKRFRSDLWFRLHVFPIHIPPLRERQEDIPALVNFFIENKCKDLQITDPIKIAPGEIDRLLTYPWPGNVRELENVIERALILRTNGQITFGNIIQVENRNEPGEIVFKTDKFPTLDHMNAMHIKQALKKTKGKIHGPNGAAALLGLNPSTLRHRMKKLSIPYGRGIF